MLYASQQGLILQSKTVVNDRISYSLIRTDSIDIQLSPNDIKRNTFLPQSGNPRIRLWAREQYMNTNHNLDQFINQIAVHIHDDNFWYTLTPESQDSKDAIDYFWFNNKKGYCEHYAQAVAIMLRSIGIPARLVLGYYEENGILLLNI